MLHPKSLACRNKNSPPWQSFLPRQRPFRQTNLFGTLCTVQHCVTRRPHPPLEKFGLPQQKQPTMAVISTASASFPANKSFRNVVYGSASRNQTFPSSTRKVWLAATKTAHHGSHFYRVSVLSGKQIFSERCVRYSIALPDVSILHLKSLACRNKNSPPWQSFPPRQRPFRQTNLFGTLCTVQHCVTRRFHPPSEKFGLPQQKQPTMAVISTASASFPANKSFRNVGYGSASRNQASPSSTRKVWLAATKTAPSTTMAPGADLV